MKSITYLFGKRLGMVMGILVFMQFEGIVYAQVTVNLPVIPSQFVGAEAYYPLTVGDLTGKNVTAFQFSLYYNKSIVLITDASTQSLMTSGAQVFFYADTSNGLINCAWASAFPLAGSGSIVNLKFKFVQTGYSLLTCVNPQNSNNTFLFNNGTPVASVNDGSVDVPLPIELNSFSCNNCKNTISLKWETKTEINNNKYKIERALVSAKDASVTWTSIGTVQSSGTSNSPKQYSYIDRNLQSGKYQYRLKMIDNDGNFEYSKIIETEVALPKDFELSQNYPNPFNPQTKINYNLPFDSKVTLEVYNITGVRVSQLVNEEQSAGYYSVDFGASNLSSGVYIYRIVASDKGTGNNFSSIKKMILLK
jgi:hypothetical protein